MSLMAVHFQITRQMAIRYGPKHVKAWHTNFPMFATVRVRLITPLTLMTVHPTF